MFDVQKTKIAAVDMVSVDVGIALVLSELESISLLKEEQKMTLKAFLDEKQVFALPGTDFSKSLIYQLALLAIVFVDLIG